MNFHEFGTDNEKIILLVHPLAVDWTVFSFVYPKLAEKYHVIIPAIPGMDLDDPKAEFTSVEEICREIEDFLLSKGIKEIECGYGCSMGGGVIIRMIADGRVSMKHRIVDAGITPYRLPKFVCGLICVGDFLMTEIGKHASVKVLGYMFDPAKYSQEDLLYVKKILSFMSARTIWNAFWSTDNYSMPKKFKGSEEPVYYWYGEKEKKARKLDIEYVKDTFQNVIFMENKGQDHAEFFTLHPEEFIAEICRVTSRDLVL